MIKVINVNKKYGKVDAVSNISFEINKNEIVGLLGPNGAGKSTTMNMITGYSEQTDGTILIDGIDIVKNPKKAKKKIGYMPEGVPLYQNMTVKDFLRFVAELRGISSIQSKGEASRVIKLTNLTEVQNSIIKKLSKGYRQRVSLAGALAGNPEILVLDEPTVGLDPKQITEIRELFKTLGKTHSILISSHILAEINQLCDRVIIINSGKILAIGTPKELIEKTNTKTLEEAYLKITEKGGI